MTDFAKELVLNGVVLVFGAVLSFGVLFTLHKCMRGLDAHLYALVYGEDEKDETPSNDQKGE